MTLSLHQPFPLTHNLEKHMLDIKLVLAVIIKVTGCDTKSKEKKDNAESGESES